MSWIGLRHTIDYSFQPAAILGPHLVRLEPRPCLYGAQKFRAQQLRIFDPPTWINRAEDREGNHYLKVLFDEPRQRLSVHSQFEYWAEPTNPFNFLLEPGFCIPHPPASASAWPSLSLPQSDSSQLIEVLCLQTNWIHSNLEYEKREETGIWDPQECLTRQKGSCRDFAFLQMRWLQAWGLEARFATGYVVEPGVSQPLPELHAWCEVYLPGAGWRGLDPTRGLWADGHYVLLSRSLQPELTSVIVGSHGPLPTHCQDETLACSQVKMDYSVRCKKKVSRCKV